MKKMYFLILSLIVGATLSRADHQPVIHDIPKQEHPKEVWINVFIHGIISIKSHITVSNFVRFLTDNIEDCIYYHTVLLMRQDPFFYQNQAVQEPGLKRIEMKQEPGAAASLMAQLFEYMNKRIYLDNPPLPTSYYYTFGWSGLLSRNVRYAEAKNLYLSLQKEVATLRSQGIEPRIRLIGYSHGGKIIMNLAAVRNQETDVDKTLHIDETLFIGMPVQCDDVYLVQDPFYKKIYNIFSSGDRVQKLDFFSCGQFFSNRKFDSRCDLKLPEKIVQVEVKVIRRKGEACLPLECSLTNELLYDGCRCSRQLRNVSPGHTELWFFGWTPLHYRMSFPLYPFPMIAFTPYILHIINSVENKFCQEHPIKIIIDPRRSTLLLENKTCNHDLYRAPFLTIAEMRQLQEKAEAYRPLNFNQKTYEEHIQQAYDKGCYLALHKKHKSATYRGKSKTKVHALP